MSHTHNQNGQLGVTNFGGAALASNSSLTGHSLAAHTHSITSNDGIYATGIPIQSVLEDLSDRVKSLEKMMLIIDAQNDLHEKYPALKEAYDHYQFTLGLIKPSEEK